jgi:glycosyltransferase involved in cell wall biosynthesis
MNRSGYNYSEILVSVMMPVYNAERYVAQAIESVLAQSYPHWELIIVDDGSTDRSGQIARQYQDARIRVYYQKNAGEAAARNQALAQMKGELLAFIDADDFYQPNHLELIVRYLADNPQRDGVYTDGYHCDEEGRRLKSLASRRRGPFEGWIFPEVVRSSDVFGPPICVALRSEKIRAWQLQFDPEIVIGPDWDFLTRYSEQASFGYIDEKTCYYRIHQTNITVKTDLRRRAGYLARCREKAIKLSRFNECPLDVRRWVFYDLLINLLAGEMERRDRITRWPEFEQLPPNEKANLLRWMATSAIMEMDNSPFIRQWYERAREYAPRNGRVLVQYWLHRISPAILRKALLILARRGGLQDPFADFKISP